MDQEIKKLWIDALRSGEYNQGEGALRTNDNRFCCLGVLCDIAAVNEKWAWDGEFRWALPREVQKWAEINSAYPVTSQGALGCLNDDGMPFIDIADLIEAQL